MSEVALKETPLEHSLALGQMTGCQVFVKKDSVQTEIFARQYAEQNGMVYVSPYNDPQVVGGQGTIAVELARQLDHIDAVFVALGGGGMIAGIASYLKAVFAPAKVIACSPQNSCVMIESMLMFIETYHLLIEGSAAVAVKAFLKTHAQWRGKNVVLVICGGNVSLKTLREILQS